MLAIALPEIKEENPKPAAKKEEFLIKSLLSEVILLSF
jgi:hypothetical protein